MESTASPLTSQGRWTSLWVIALLSLIAQLWLCSFFSFGTQVPTTIDVNPSNLWKYAYQFPPSGSFLVLNWLGLAYLPLPMSPFAVAANLPVWLFFTTFAPLMGTCALLAMAAFLRELELPRPAALFGGVVYAWQGDLLPFVFPGHFGYIATWPFFAIAAWGALRAQRTRLWPYALISGVSCGMMITLQQDRGAIASLLIAALYLAPALRPGADWFTSVRHVALCAAVALAVSLATFLALFQSNIVGVKLGGESDREKTYDLVTQFSLSPQETLTYLAPGFFGWHTSTRDGLYWGEIGRSRDWPRNPDATRNLNLAISTTGTVASVLAIAGALVLLGELLGPTSISRRQRFYGRLLLGLGFVTLVLSWGWHTPFYRPLFALPLMDKWRNPLKWLEVFNFALVTLSAFGVQHLASSFAPEATLVRRRLVWFAGGVLAVLTSGVLASYPFTIVLRQVLIAEGYGITYYNNNYHHPIPDPVMIAKMLDTLHVAVIFAAVLMALVCGLLYALWNPEKWRQWKLPNPFLDRAWHVAMQPDYLPLTLALGLSALSVVQLGWVTTQFVKSSDLSTLTQTNDLLEALQSEGDTVRVSVAAEDPLLNMFLQNQFAADHISSLEISAASRIPDDLYTFFNALGNDRARLWFLAGVKNVAVPQQFVPQLHHDPKIFPNIDHADGYNLVPIDAANTPSHALIELRDYLAKATFVPNAEIIPDEKALLKRLADPDWNPRATVLLPAPAHSIDPPDAQSKPTAPQVSLPTYTPHEIEAVVLTGRPGYLLINDHYDPDWEVQVNGHDTELLRANYIMRAVPLPAGTSTVTLRYVAHYRFGGLNLPALVVNNFSDASMLVSWIVAGLALRRRRGMPDISLPF